MIIVFKRFSNRAHVPIYAKPGDSGADLRVADPGGGLIWPGETRVMWTDIGVQLPAGHEAQVRPRSSVSRRGLLVHHGSVDQGFRGNIGITITNLSRDPIAIASGDRLAQLVIAPVVRGEFFEADELEPSERGACGYGSSGK